MRLPMKKAAQLSATVLFCVYLSVLFYHAVAQIGQQQLLEDRAGSDNGFGAFTWQERAPRSLSDASRDYDNTADSGDDQRTKGRLLQTLVEASTNKPTTTLSDVFISVKTTKSFHESRLDLILKTWFILARKQTWFFTDSDDSKYQEKTSHHLVNTNCSSSHNRRALCCKMSVEFDAFLESGKKWFCHFDDDNYVNVPQLVKMLQGYSPQEDWYLGKPSIRAPLEILNRDDTTKKLSFWFATGGAGFCISRALALKMMPFASGGKFISIGEKIRLPDDVTMGYIIEHLLHQKLTVVEEFHSHLEPMRFIKPDTYPDQITFSYSSYGKEMNVLQMDGFDSKLDPTRLLSLHCHLFPNFSYCPR